MKVPRFPLPLIILCGATFSSFAAPVPGLDSEAQKVMNKLAELEPKPIASLTPEQARLQPTPGDAVMALLEERGASTAPKPVGKIENRTIPGRSGEIPVRIYTPKGDGPFPVTVYYHGGGWVIATIDTYDASARALTNAANSVVVAVEYRKAPEHKFPAAADDAYDAYLWTVENAKNIKGDPQRVAVAGESAGGNLATVVARRARDAKAQLPVHQLLIYPVTNYAFDTESYREQAKAKPLNADMMKWFWGHYLNNPSEGSNPDASPLRAKLEGLPPATVITAEIDPLRSEGKAYADRLREAGIDVEYKNYDGMPHEFFGMGAVLPESKNAVQVAATGLSDSTHLAQNSDPQDSQDSQDRTALDETNSETTTAIDSDANEALGATTQDPNATNRTGNVTPSAEGHGQSSDGNTTEEGANSQDPNATNRTGSIPDATE